MECHMPKMAGLEATAAISAAESRTDRHVPVIALTASALEADRDRCLAMGMADLLTQPIGRAELAAMQDRWIPLRVEATRTS